MQLNITKTYAYNNYQMHRHETKVERIERKIDKLQEKIRQEEQKAEKYATICASIDSNRLLREQAERVAKARENKGSVTTTKPKRSTAKKDEAVATA